MGDMRNAQRVLVAQLAGNNLEYLGKDGRIILKWSLRK
jgi:hypothetical protein